MFLTFAQIYFIADIFEGDLKLDKEDIDEATKGSLTRRDAVVGASRVWAGARVPYILDRSFGKRLCPKNCRVYTLREMAEGM